MITPSGSVLQGEVVIEGDTITCVAADFPDPRGASVFTVSGAFIFPGFIDAHNHMAYNVLPKWTTAEALPESRSMAGVYRLWRVQGTLRDPEGPEEAVLRDGQVGRDRRADQRNHHGSRDSTEPDLLQGPRQEHRESNELGLGASHITFGRVGAGWCCRAAGDNAVLLQAGILLAKIDMPLGDYTFLVRVSTWPGDLSDRGERTLRGDGPVHSWRR
jgi:hypothetical protein